MLCLELWMTQPPHMTPWQVTTWTLPQEQQQGVGPPLLALLARSSASASSSSRMRRQAGSLGVRAGSHVLPRAR